MSIADEKMKGYQQFKDTLIALSKTQDYLQMLNEFRQLSIELAPQYLYRYRSCTPRALNALENAMLSFSAPATFRDDTEDAFIPVDYSFYDEKLKLATGDMFPWLDYVSSLSPQECSEEFSRVFFPDNVRNDLFQGLLPDEAAKQRLCLSKNEKKRRISNAMEEIQSRIRKNDVCNMLRDQFKVACLCEDSNSTDMWNRYADMGTGFQIEYRCSDLFGMGLSGESIPILFPIIYEPVRPSMSEFAMLLALPNSGALLQEASDPLRIYLFTHILQALFIKNASKYSYEQEWRILLPNPSLNEMNGDFTLRKCGCSRIRLGERISASDERLIRAIAKELEVPVVRFDDK